MNRRSLENKNAVIHGAGGAIAREGARVFLAGRSLGKLEAVAKDVAAAGGVAETAQVDALDERAVNTRADAVAMRAGHIDIAVNAVGIMQRPGDPFAELSVEDYAHPIAGDTRTNFITAKAAARHMISAGRGVILTLSTPGSRMAGAGFIGYGVTCAAVEALTRLLAAELGPSGIRVNCLRPHAIPEAAAGARTARTCSAPSPAAQGSPSKPSSRRRRTEPC
jgi:NAD(P)-dependent dehydrogenase (short-subunit alcohol dehydrogenase family)